VRFIAIAVWASLFFALAFFALPKYEVSEHLQAGALGNIQTANIARIWFSAAGELVGIGKVGSHITIHVWDGHKGAQLRERALELPNTKELPDPVYAVSSDASKIAWIGSDGVHAEDTFPAAQPVVSDHPFRRRVPISSLALTGSSVLATLYRDGELELSNLNRGTITVSKPLSIAEPGPLLSNGVYLAVSSLLSRDVFVFDTGSGDKLSVVEYAKYPPDMLSVTLSPMARLAAGTRDKLLMEDHPIPAPGPIRALAYYDRDRVLVGGDYPGILLLSQAAGPMKAAVSDPGTTVLAATESLLAFGTSRHISLYSHRMVQVREFKGLGMPTPWLVLALLGLISPAAIPLFQGGFKKLWQWILKFWLREPVTAGPPISAQDDSMPSVLVDACLNGDCVLYAGAGLSAQAGLPLWNDWVRELVNRSSDNNLAPAGVIEAALADLSRGQTGAAADRMATALEIHEQVLHTYLRQRFRVTSELSAAHLLIKQIEFPALITTNLDNLLERTFPQSGGRVYTAGDCETLATAATRRDFFLLKPFGDLDEPHTIRLGPTQCEEVIQSNPACSDVLGQLLQLRTFLFVGSSLEGIERDLGYITPQTNIEHKHYAFVAAAGEEQKAAAERLSQRYGIALLTYTPASPSHSEVIDFLTKLHTAMRERSATPKEYVDAL
jgi:SIR2-like domain